MEKDINTVVKGLKMRKHLSKQTLLCLKQTLIKTFVFDKKKNKKTQSKYFLKTALYNHCTFKTQKTQKYISIYENM